MESKQIIAIMVNGDIAEINLSSGKTHISYEEIRRIAFPLSTSNSLTCTWQSEDGKLAGILIRGHDVELEDGMIFKMKK